MFDTVAVIGATGAVGTIILELLEKRNFPAGKYRLFSSKRSAGTQIQLAGKTITVEELTHDCFEGIDLVIASTPDDTAAEFLQSAVKAGAKVIDESGYWRMHPDVALVVPEINPEAALNAKGIIASPNCSTTQMVVAMKPLYDVSKIKRVVVSTYQATSGAGLQGKTDLKEGTQAALEGRDYKYTAFVHPVAFNAIPQIGGLKESGYTSEEMKMVYETRKIFGDESIMVCPTCVRIPVSTATAKAFLSKLNDRSVWKKPKNCSQRLRELPSSTIWPIANTPCLQHAMAATTCSLAGSAKT